MTPPRKESTEDWLRRYVATLPGFKVVPDALARVTPKGVKTRSVFADFPAVAKAIAELNPVTQAARAGYRTAEVADTHGLLSKATAGELAAAAPLLVPGGSAERLAGRAARVLRGAKAAEVPESLVAAAVRYPDGSIGYGPSHFHALQQGSGDLAQTAEGFLTNSGRFVDRNEAARMTGAADELHSADLVQGLPGYGGKQTGLLRPAAGAPLPVPPPPKRSTREVLASLGVLIPGS